MIVFVKKYKFIQYTTAFHIKILPATFKKREIEVVVLHE